MDSNNQPARAYDPPEKSGLLPVPKGRPRRSLVGAAGRAAGALYLENAATESESLIPTRAAGDADGDDLVLTDGSGFPPTRRQIELAEIGEAEDPEDDDEESRPPGLSDGQVERVLAAQQAALRQALRSAAQASSKLESLQYEMVRVRDRLQRTEQMRLSQALAFRSQAAAADAKLQNLSQELANTTARNKSLEARSRVSKSGWMAMVAAVSAVAACAFLVSHPSYLNAKAVHADSSAIVGSVRPGGTSGKIQTRKAGQTGSGSESPEEKALDRLDRAMAGLPAAESSSVLREVNKKLTASGAPPCTANQKDGRSSLVVTSGAKGQGMITAALGRCADAVEDAVR